MSYLNLGEYSVEGAKAAPTLAVTGTLIAGVPLHDVVLVATLIYTALQIFVLVFRFVKNKGAK